VNGGPQTTGVLYFDELSVGQTWSTQGRTITESDLLSFGTWSGDLHPLHTDKEYARRTDFGRTYPAWARCSLSTASGLEMATGWKIGSALAFLGIRHWNFRAPVRIGDTISVHEEIVDLRLSSTRADRGVVTSKVKVIGHDGGVCQEGTWVMLIACRPTHEPTREETVRAGRVRNDL
jgi:acyl dehydratase